MNFEINEIEFYNIPMITQLKSYDIKLEEGNKVHGEYKTSIAVDLIYYDNNLNENSKLIKLPIEINLGDKDIIKLELKNVEIQVIDNQGINIVYNLLVEVSDVEIAFEPENLSFEDTQVEVDSIITEDNIEEIKESVTASYEEVLDNTGIREVEELPVTYVDKDELSLLNLKEDFNEMKVLFNIDVDRIDKLAFKYNLSIDECYKKLTKDKNRLII